MYRLFVLLAIFFLLFMGVNVQAAFGWNIASSSSPIWQRISPAVYIFIALAAIKLSLSSDTISILKKNKKEAYIIVCIILMMAYLFISKAQDFLGIMINALMLPAVVSLVLPKDPLFSLSNLEFSKQVRNLIISFLVVNSVIAIGERLFNTNIFPLLGGQGDTLSNFKHEFRSTALQNHPLSNALVTSIIMSFILVSNFKPLIKFSLWFLGFVAILCFNTRSSIFGWLAFISIYLIFTIFLSRKESINTKIALVSLSSVLAMVGTALLFNYGFGDRLLNMGLYDDDSASVRTQIWSVFDNHSVFDFLGGMSEGATMILANNAGVEIIENFWLIYLFRFGLIFTAIITLLYYLLIKRELITFGLFQKLFVVGVFLLISSTNNSLASQASIALPAFVICTYAFKTKTIQ